MKRFVSSLLITGCLWAIANLSDSQYAAQTTTSAHSLRLALDLRR